jgi:hypothetical protein
MPFGVVMLAFHSIYRQSRYAAAALLLLGATHAAADPVSDLGLVNKGLVTLGRLPADLRDKFGETFGSGSGLAADVKDWTRGPDGYRGTLYMLPDRGYNISGTSNYRARLNKLTFTLRPSTEARPLALELTLADTILLTDAAGKPLTGLDPLIDGIRPPADGFPPLPQATTGAVSIDAEAIVRLDDGSFFVSDEYGPYIYRFSADGRMISAIRPPEAFIPKRNGRDSFSSNNPGPDAPAPKPENPDSGRQNNQGFEGLALTPDGQYLVALLQSATRQDGGSSPETRQNTRMLYYDIADRDRPKLVREHVVPLPFYITADGKRRVAAQSELLALDDNRFLVICRDSGSGYALETATSRYRRIELLDVSKATDIAGSTYDNGASLAPAGKLIDGIVPATLTTFIDINDNAQLGKFGLHNGEPNDRNNLYEKWEGLALLPALDPANPRDFFLFVSNDNDFITQNGFQANAPYKDQSGADVDTMVLVYRVTIPELRKN